jgi:hypothetical protein
MVKHQIHEEFQTFTGVSLEELSKAISDYVVQNNVAAKSLSVLQKNRHQLIASIGYRSDEASYPVSLESVELPFDMQTMDANLSTEAEKAPGDVICHSLFVTSDNRLTVAFLLHG